MTGFVQRANLGREFCSDDVNRRFGWSGKIAGGNLRDRDGLAVAVHTVVVNHYSGRTPRFAHDHQLISVRCEVGHRVWDVNKSGLSGHGDALNSDPGG